MKRLIIASDNLNKISEIKNALRGLPVEVIGKGELGISLPPVEENAPQLEGNADLKAKSIKEICPEDFVLADDTGLFVDALDGEPGVHSARYAGNQHDDEANKKKLLRKMEDCDDRNAYFETVLVLYDPSGQKSILTGHCNGRIAREEHGDNGFGYDPLFFPEDSDRSFAEMDTEEKNKISHRGRALQALRQYFETFGVL